jgi:hypothetical protein
MPNPGDGANKRSPARKANLRSSFPAAFFVVPVLAATVSLSLLWGDQIHRNPFEGREPVWVKGAADAQFKETVHDISDVAHTGQHSEHILVSADQGTYIHYFYPTSKAPVGDQLNASVWVKANRLGLQLLGRVVLPREHDQNNPDTLPTTSLRGDQYQRVGRWQRLELRNPLKLAKEQQQFMRAELKRDVDFTDAYVDRLVLNVYGGPGETEVWIDDLEIGPVVDASPFQTTSRPIDRQRQESSGNGGRIGAVEVKNEHLAIDGKNFFIRGIRHTDTPLTTLREAGFNTVWFDYRASPAVVDEAVRLGFLVVPALAVTGPDQQLASADGLNSELNRFMLAGDVLFWDIGGGLVDEQKDQIYRAVQTVRNADARRPVGADVWDGLGPYSRNMIDLIGVHRWPLMTGMELSQFREWLEQRRLLSRPASFTWTWIQTHLPDWYSQLIYEQAATAGFNEPIGPQPEQVRLLTYAALAAGCRGLGFWSDRFLANTHQGRDRLLQIGLLNQELQMLEPLLTEAQPPRWVDTSLPEVKAAVFRTDHFGVLVVPMWLGNGAQFVPGQYASAALTVTVPDVPAGTMPYEISPVEVRSLPYERIIGGTRVTLSEFGLTAAVLFTADNNPTGIIVRLQNQVRRMREQSAKWALDLAEVEIDKVGRVESQLEADGHRLTDSQALMTQVRKRWQTASELYSSKDYRQAYQEAERALRPLRLLMRSQWEQATKSLGLDSAIASPYAVSFYTLPRHWQFIDQVRNATPGPNLLHGGDFEASPSQVSENWTTQEARLDPVVMTARRVSEMPKEGKQCLLLEIKPRDPAAPPGALERTFLAINSPAVQIQPGTLVRVSGWMRIPNAITATADGALLYDSAGGEPLAVRLMGPTGWKKFTLYRRVPPTGSIYVTMALTGLGQVYFDDIRIEPLLGSSAAPAPAGR